MWLPWFIVRRRLLRKLREIHDAAITPEACVDPSIERAHLAEAARIGRVISNARRRDRQRARR